VFADSPDAPDSALRGHGSAQTAGPEGRPATPTAQQKPQAVGVQRLRELGFGFVYWLTFLLLLEPGNLVGGLRAGVQLDWTQEILRILGASLLGAAVTPVVFWLSRRFPIEGERWRQGALAHAAAIVALCLALIAVAHVLAALFLTGRDPRLVASLAEEIASNGALLIVPMSGLAALAHALRFRRRAEQQQALLARSPEPEGWLARVPVKGRGGVTLLPLSDVDWIETQGNYLALHVGAKVHLIRESLARFEARLDPARFVRIHRRTIVAADRVRGLSHLSNGDALIRLEDGSELRMSRGYRARAQVLFAAPGAKTV